MLTEGARALGMSIAPEEEGEGEQEGEGEGEGEMFPRGSAELVDYFEQKCNQNLNEYMEKLANEDQLEGSKLIKAAVKYRLEMLAPYIDNWPQVYIDGIIIHCDPICILTVSSLSLSLSLSGHGSEGSSS